ncbi:hypothetical protein RRG08_023299 [Elysia crispata]|uniref:Uncharacterized protein n=1 Tax=Elysia crispata TaxID=231223 RepID=A0AAE1EDK2_9GAST|nr:hypothetical protein RRG08_023299 [Elysia crispata]
MPGTMLGLYGWHMLLSSTHILLILGFEKRRTTVHQDTLFMRITVKRVSSPIKTLQAGFSNKTDLKLGQTRGIRTTVLRGVVVYLMLKMAIVDSEHLVLTQIV